MIEASGTDQHEVEKDLESQQQALVTQLRDTPKVSEVFTTVSNTYFGRFAAKSDVVDVVDVLAIETKGTSGWDEVFNKAKKGGTDLRNYDASFRKQRVLNLDENQEAVVRGTYVDPDAKKTETTKKGTRPPAGPREIGYARPDITTALGR